MRVISVAILRDFWVRHPDAENPLKTWYAVAKKAQWSTPSEIKAQFGSVSILQNNRVVFNIAGNKYRLVVAINYFAFVLMIKFVGTHAEYDRIDAQKVRLKGER